MLRSTLIAAAIVAAATGAASAQTPPVYAGGFLVVLTDGAACEGVGARIGDLHTAIFRAHLAPAHPPASLQIFQPQAALRIQDKFAADFTSTFYKAQMFSENGGFVAHEGNSDFAFTPATLNPATRRLEVRGRIENFKNAGDCAVTFRAELHARP
jgi:hypothetical protein